MPPPVEKGLEVAAVYAAALFELAERSGRVDEVRSELEELLRLVDEAPQLAAFLSSAVIYADQRATSLERMFRGRLSDIVLNTLLVMDRRGRLALWHPLLRAYILHLEHARHQVEVTATSAIELSAAERTAIETLAATLTGKQPVLEYIVDPDVLGGLVLQIGDRRLDYSVRRHLFVARSRLLERSNVGTPAD